MPAPFPEEIRKRAVLLARERAKPVAKVAEELGTPELGLRRWLAQADVDEGIRDGLTTSERKKLVRWHNENRLLRMERELLSRAAAFLASENVLPK